MMKLMIVGRRRGGMTVAQLHRYMVETHGAAVVDYIGKLPDETPQRYVQNHVYDGTYRVPDGSADPLMLNRDFVTQVWFKDMAQMKLALSAPFYQANMKPDEDRFVDQSTIVRLPSDVTALFGAGTVPAGSAKLFVLHRLGSGVSYDDFDTASRAEWQPILDAADDNGLQKVVRNRVKPVPGQAPTVDLVDEAWLADDEAASAMGARWQALVEGGALASMLVPKSSVLLCARERVLFAGLPDAVAAAG